MEALNKLPWAAKSPIFKKVSEISDISALSREERLKYDAAIKIYRDNLCVYEDAVESGFKKGMEKGMAEGKEEGITMVAHNLKSMGMSLAAIEKATGLSPEVIEKL